MSDTPNANDRLLDILRDRERTLETDLAAIRARLEEVRETLALLTSRPRGRPRAVRSIEPAPELIQNNDGPEAA